MKARVSLVALVAASACASDAPPAVTVTDSAGITVTLSPDAGATYAIVDPEPLVSLGGANAVGPEQFYVVTGVHLDARGRIWVSDYQSGELRVFGADGSHLFTRGGRGDGPGEFRGIRLVGEMPGDSILVADQPNGRVSVYEPDGDLARTERILNEGRAFPRPFDVYPDGSVLGQVPVVYASDAVEAGQLLPSQVRLVRFSTDRPQRTLVEGIEGAPFVWTGTAMVPIPFTANAAFGLRGEELHLAAGPDFRIRVYDGDRLVRIYGVDRPRQPVGPDDVAAYRDRVETAYSGQRQEDFLSVLDRPEVPDNLPAYPRLVVSRDGTVWAGRYGPDAPWDVYGVDGALLGSVRVPADFNPTSIRNGHIAGVWLDDLAVEHVRVYAVTRTRGD